MTQVVDAFLPTDRKDAQRLETLERVTHLSDLDDQESEDELRRLIMEAMRLHSAIPGVYRFVAKDVKVHGNLYEKGDRVYVAVAEAQKTVSSNMLWDSPMYLTGVQIPSFVEQSTAEGKRKEWSGVEADFDELPKQLVSVGLLRYG